MSEFSLKLILYLLIGGGVTVAYRVLPFILFGKRTVPEMVNYLGEVLPMAIMLILIIHCVKDTSFANAGGFLPQLAALAVTAAVHIWKRSTSLSIFLGTACYMVLLRVL